MHLLHPLDPPLGMSIMATSKVLVSVSSCSLLEREREDKSIPEPYILAQNHFSQLTSRRQQVNHCFSHADPKAVMGKSCMECGVVLDPHNYDYEFRPSLH